MELTAVEKRSPGTMELVARGMVRGQGKTEGYHERIIPFSEKAVARAFGRAGDVKEIGEIARRRVDQVAIVRGILRHAVSTAAAGGDANNIGDEHRARANPWANKLDEVVDRDFFHDLQDEFELDNYGERDKVRNEWLNGVVVKGARDLLDQACDSLPCPSIQRLRARVQAKRLFDGRLRGDKGLPFLFDDKEKTECLNS